MKRDCQLPMKERSRGYVIERKTAPERGSSFGSLVPAVGIEPTTNGLQNGFVPTWSFVTQTLAALANLKTDVIKAQLGHSQSGEGTICCHRPVSQRIGSQDGPTWFRAVPAAFPWIDHD